MKQELQKKLSTYNYSYIDFDDRIKVKFPNNLRISIYFLEEGKYRFSDRLSGWNFLTGFLDMSVKNAIVYNTISLFITAFVLAFIIPLDNIAMFRYFVFIMIAITGWVLLWTVYYLVLLENFKSQIIRWIDEASKK